MAFNTPEINYTLLRLPLDDHYLPDKDIHRFLDNRFRSIRQTHPLGRRLGHTWPAPALVKELVDKSSGQFIYALVVINFMFSPRSNPAASLDIVRGLQHSGRLTPFSQLDALYGHIFSSVHDLQATLPVLAYVILSKNQFISPVSRLFSVKEDDMHAALGDLTSDIRCTDIDIAFLHASLPDFLLDRSRSREYCIDAAFWGTHLSIRWYRHLAAGGFGVSSYRELSIVHFLNTAEGSSELRDSVLSFEPLANLSFYLTPEDAVGYLPAIPQA